MRDIWRDLKRFALMLELKKTSLSNIGISVIHAD
jgi:hypothetical protein